MDFTAKAKSPIDIVVRSHDYAVGSSTGWHSHPGPVFIAVKKAELTYYEYDDPNCTPHVVQRRRRVRRHWPRPHRPQRVWRAGQDVSVIVAPVGAAFRGELAAPGPYCRF